MWIACNSKHGWDSNLFKYTYIYHCANNWLKERYIRSQGYENWIITVILSILISGEKLPPLLICKGKKGKDAEIKLQEIECEEKNLYSDKKMRGILKYNAIMDS